MTNEEEFSAFLERIRQESIVALDTESNSFHAYYERVCLLQLSTRDADFVVDPFSVDVRPLGEALANPAVEVVVHAADYDIRSLKRDFGFRIQHLFDTMLAARMLGRREVSLAALVRAHFGVRLAKEHQRSDWGRRPLSPEQLEYAATDTRFLLALRDLLQAEIVQAGRQDEARRLFEKQAACEPRPKRFDVQGFRRIHGFRTLSVLERSIVQALYLLREDCARAINRPPFKVFSDETMVEVARQQPRTCEELSKIKGVGVSMVRRNGEAIVASIAKALQNDGIHAA